MKLFAGAASDVGRVRERNEDSFLVDDRLTLFAVADGMGGHRGGAVASSTSLEALRAAVAAGEEISAAIQTSNRAVYEASVDDPSLAGMGTTLTALLALGGSSLLVGHVGDSRAYLVRDGALRQITEDHSLVEELVREGRLTREQAEVHPQRSIITRALGVDPSVDVDVFTIDVRAGDRVLLCSDGLTTMLRDREVEQLARAEDDPRRAADRLVDAANAAGGEDNITVLVVDVLETDADDEPPNPEYFATLGPKPEGRDTAPVTAPIPLPPEDVGDPPLLAVAPPWTRAKSLALVVVPVMLVIVVAFAVLGWYARRSYYVGIEGDDVVVFKGVPGGVLWWDPTVDVRTGISVDDLTAADAAALAEGAAEGSQQRAQDYVDRLEARTVESTTTTTSTPPRSTTSTTTTAPPGSTTTPPPATSGA